MNNEDTCPTKNTPPDREYQNHFLALFTRAESDSDWSSCNKEAVLIDGDVKICSLKIIYS